MQHRWKKIVLRALLIVIGVPALLIAAILAWGYFADTTNGSIVSSGITRRYLLYVPRSYDRTKATPLVISLHPAATWGAFERNVSGWNELAEQHGFIVVYPNGSGAFFGGFSAGQHVWPQGQQSLPRDAKFISGLIDKLEREYNIDAKRIYADGMSNGGGMAYALSCELPDRIAAVGVVAGAVESGKNCRDTRPVPVIVFHGAADKFAAYEGGKPAIAPVRLENIPDWIARVARRNQCRGGASESRVSTNVRRAVYSGCTENADVVFYTIEGGGHTWPGGKHLPRWLVGHTTDEISASGLMWEFYQEHPRK
ncbi:MAG TPA: PHB depolymerase family esterase [Candidatus Angelobacter sp.]|nr:PHB depolymerase family esterase [Candidatus Angelobacter sp.]